MGGGWCWVPDHRNHYPELVALNVENFKTDKLQPVNTLLKEAEKRNLSLVTGIV